MKGKVKITLTEFGDEKTIPLEEFKDWFPSGRFDKRYPDEYLRKWLKINNTYLDKLNITYRWDEEKKSLSLIPGNKIGLVPLKNPYGRNVYGSIEVKPRLGWINLYEIFDLIDWKYQPTFLKNEEPILSNGVFPKWIKAIDTLEAINQALNLYMKGMNNKQVIINEPKGIINWYDYSIKSLPYGKYNEFYSFITDYSIDLEVHRQFKGIVSLIHGDIFHSKVPLKIKNKAKELVTKAEKKLEKT
ncbi:MAG TPA: hypothetical protein DEA47_05125 [Peptococcaceae bacterium]|nr:MAG: hypothetical protein XD50_1124 [Clostridia bacterium 41_269]HBT20725.1 hypothetical protein [Peptococcaceae bacterium]